MIRELKETHSYPTVMLLLSVLTFIFGTAFAIFGELLLPFATASAAALFFFEKPNRRIFSFVIPVITLGISFILNGFYAVVCIEYVILAFLIALLYRRGISKAECFTYLSLITAVFMVFALYLGAGKATGSFTFESVSEFYSDIYARLRTTLVDFLSTRQIVLTDGTVKNYMSVEEAGYYFDSFAKLLPALFGAAAMILSGLAIKLFSGMIFKFSKNGMLKTFAHFMPSTIVAYTYIAVAIIAIFTGIDGGWLAVAIINASEIMMLVYAFIGFNYLKTLGIISQRKTTVYMIVVASLLLMGGTALQILSIVGVWFVITGAKMMKE